jgi:hypothetical protein
MKRLIILAAILLGSIAGFSQTFGGDGYISVTYTGYKSGSYTFMIINLVPRFDPTVTYAFTVQDAHVTATSTGWNGGEAPKKDTTYLTITAAFNELATFTFWPLTNDSRVPNNAAFTIDPPVDLPVTFTSAPVFKGNTVSFNVANQNGIARYNVQVSRDGGKTWQTVTVVAANNTFTSGTYSAQIPLK